MGNERMTKTGTAPTLLLEVDFADGAVVAHQHADQMITLEVNDARLVLSPVDFTRLVTAFTRAAWQQIDAAH